MKKLLKKVLSIIFMIFAVFIGVGIGLLILSYVSKGTEGIAILLESLLGLFLAYNVGIIVHESGHLVFGLLTGYKFSSFRIWSLMLVKQNGKMNLRKYKLMGTGGQCLMIPNDNYTVASVVLYNLGGVIFNFLSAVISFALYHLIPETYLVSKLLWYTCAFSVITIITNGIPLNIGGIANDGMNALHLSKNPDAAEAFRKQLLINAAQSEGKKTYEIPDEWFRLRDGADMQNVHCASMAVFEVSRHLDRGDTVTAEREISGLLASDYNIIGLHRSLLTCDLISAKLINDPNADISTYPSPMLGKVMKSMKNHPPIIRTQYIIALLSERDEKKAAKILSTFDKKTAGYPYRQNVEIDRELMMRALEIFKNKV